MERKRERGGHEKRGKIIVLTFFSLFLSISVLFYFVVFGGAFSKEGKRVMERKRERGGDEKRGKKIVLFLSFSFFPSL